ncbi:hypothetical protein JMJ58_03675 [Haloterrigena salifodinae]|uniref:DUF8139 domain-containing protein n=1 Tax=Haloterrigena salifodinae TaxID=2675099 RepID=A0A8T8E2M4_9EURY|nr:hypothetical protein [Haloterrigena salifodinae]QRV16008.1 hypothetical protein JMJ58_03675 [Haloterrigena salifodinae]
MLKEGDRVRVDIPDRDDPDFRFHRQTGVITDVLEDAAVDATGDERDKYLYRVELEDDVMDFRWRDLRPVSEGE